jgi:hypothetical protein
MVANTGGYGLKLRAGHCTNDLSCPNIATMPDGTAVRIIGGPVQAEGFSWWNLSSPYGVGWSATGFWLK